MTTSLSLDEVIQARATTKVFAEEPRESTTDRQLIHRMLTAAGWAPFHRPAHKSHCDGNLSSLVPWRAYTVDSDGCRELRTRLLDAGDAGKLPQMLAAADGLIQVTWLPDPHDGDDDYAPSINNMEHIAAAGAAIQNMLLVATEQGVPTYWSSGGALRQSQVFDWLGIPDQEILLGAIFLFPSDETETTRVPGKLRDRRGELNEWSRSVESLRV